MSNQSLSRLAMQLLGDQQVGQWGVAMDAGTFSPAHASSYCWRCGASIGKEAITKKGCSFCINQHIHWQKMIRVEEYQKPLSQWICSLKFQRSWRWANMLGKLMLPHLDIPELHDQQVAVCPVPMHWYRRWERGFNQAHLIADCIGKHYHWPVMPLLKRTRYTPPQTHVVPSQRTTNVSQSVAAKNIDLSDWTVVLVDDVKTSGATLNNCCRKLKGMGCKQIIASVIAVADQHHAHFSIAKS